MKKIFIGSLLLLAVLLASVPANATTCLCVGYSNGKTCGKGGMGGDFLMVINSVESNLIQYYLLTVALRAQLAGTGKAYDSQTGWYCWNGSLN